MAALATRIKRLEEATGAGEGGPPCKDCGWGGWGGEPDDHHDHDTYEVAFTDPDEDLGPEFCPSCERRLVLEIWFDDDPHAPWGARRSR